MTKSPSDVALVQDKDGTLSWHRADCPDARAAAAAGQPVMTMLGITKSIPHRLGYRWHSCLEG